MPQVVVKWTKCPTEVVYARWIHNSGFAQENIHKPQRCSNDMKDDVTIIDGQELRDSNCVEFQRAKKN